jgi:hypothetical protein
MHDGIAEYSSGGCVMSVEKIVQMVGELPPNLQQEVEDFVEFLLEKSQREPKYTPTFVWAGALQEMRQEYSSVDLQHQISGWRLENSKGASE